MKKLRCAVLIGAILTIVVLLAGCGNTGNSGSTDNSDSGTAPDAAQQPTETEYGSYQQILDDYSAKIREATPSLVEEYKAEAANNTEGISGLAAILNEKVQVLANISMEGVEKMAQFMYDHGSGR